MDKRKTMILTYFLTGVSEAVGPAVGYRKNSWTDVKVTPQRPQLKKNPDLNNLTSDPLVQHFNFRL